MSSGRELPPVYIDTYMPSMGALMGGSASSELLNQINANSGSTFIGERYQALSNTFMTQIVQPMRQQALELKANADRLVRPDEIRALTTMEDFTIIPPCMQMVVLTHPTVRALHRAGRVTGYGFSPEELPAEDMYGRILNNGYCRDYAAALVEGNGTFTLEYHEFGDDPEFNNDQIGWLQSTRDAIDRWAIDPAQKHIDITSPDTLVG